MVKTIRVDEDVHKQLNDFKIYDRETMLSVIKRLIQGEAYPSGDGKPSNLSPSPEIKDVLHRMQRISEED